MKRHVIFKILFIIYLIAVAYLCFAGSDSVPKIPRRILGIEGDKFGHFVMFFPFSPLAFLSIRNLPRGWFQKSFLMLVVFLTGCGVSGLTEMIQSFTPDRIPDWMDMRADVYALLCSSVISWLTVLSIPDSKIKKHKQP